MNKSTATTPQDEREDHTDYLGHALELESAAKKVESQTAERAMLAGAHCLRIAHARAALPAQAVAMAIADLEKHRRIPPGVMNMPLDAALRTSGQDRIVDHDMLGKPITAGQVAALAAPVQAVAPTDAREDLEKVTRVLRDLLNEPDRTLEQRPSRRLDLKAAIDTLDAIAAQPATQPETNKEDPGYNTGDKDLDLLLDAAYYLNLPGANQDDGVLWLEALEKIQAKLTQQPNMVSAMSLNPIIAWLEGGCDPKAAAQELRLLVQKVPK